MEALNYDKQAVKMRLEYLRKVVRFLEDINMGYEETCIDMTVEILEKEINRLKKGR